MTPKKDKPEFLRPRQVPERGYPFTERQVRRYIDKGRIPVTKPSGLTGPAYVSSADLDRLIEDTTKRGDR